MSSYNNMISNDIMRAVTDYITENEKNKIPTKNISKVGEALGMIRILLEGYSSKDDSDPLSITVDYGETDVTLNVILPLEWSFNKNALKTWKKILGLVDEFSHQPGDTDENGVPVEDTICFCIRNVFEAPAE